MELKFKIALSVDLPESRTIVVLKASNEIGSTLKIGKLPQKSTIFLGKVNRSANPTTLHPVLSVLTLVGKDCLEKKK